MAQYTSLLFTILATTLMMAALRETQRRGLDLFQVTAFNYFTAVALGLCFSPDAFHQVFVEHHAVSHYALALGASFILIFLVMGKVADLAGLAYMAFLGKMALMIPVLFSWFRYGEALTPLRITGIALALVAIVLITRKKKGTTPSANSVSAPALLAILSVILFIGNGAIDCQFKIFSTELSGMVSDEAFAIVAFFVAGTLGMGIVLYRAIAKGIRFKPATILGGILVGLPNYFSLVCLTKGLQQMDGTVFFPVNNVGILMAATLIGVFIFRERFSALNAVGLAVAVAAIVLMV
jgi:drug/metabolite transporter (DMT)-like permease